MKNSTDQFQKTIQEYLEKRASTDELFAETFKKEGKNIKDCTAYILGQVKKANTIGFADAEIYNMAVHYYDEDELEVGEIPNCKIIVNQTIELTEEEKSDIKKAVEDKEIARIEALPETERKAMMIANKDIVLDDKEEKEAKERAIREEIDASKAKMRKRTAKATGTSSATQTSLF